MMANGLKQGHQMDDVEFIQAPDGQCYMLADKIKERIEAYINLLNALSVTKEQALSDHGLTMLETIRQTIQPPKEASLTAIKGGKH